MKIACRNSTLSLKQADELRGLLPDMFLEIVTASTFGDLHKDLSLITNTKADIFTDTLDRMVLEGAVEAALHSAKDLPFPLDPALCVCALTDAADQTDCLVTRHASAGLVSLPPGAVVGTSSASRSRQLLRHRPDLKARAIRGTIEERLRQVDEGEYDAVIMATIALKRLGLQDRIGDTLPFTTHPLQGMLAVTCRRDRRDIRSCFAPIDARARYGAAFIAGFGPGDKELMSLKTARLIDEAEVILFDDLVDATALSGVTAETIYVGKRKGHHRFSQDTINQMLYQSVRSGKRTLRLKGGDPFIFGRGGEEVLYLRERLVEVEVVPGITAAQAAAAAAQIPLTHRDMSRSVSYLSAHYRDGKLPAIPATDTTAFYMSASRPDTVREALLDAGHPPEEPVCLVHAAGAPDQKIVRCSLLSLGDTPQNSPLITIAGPVASLAAADERILYTGLDPRHIQLPGRVHHVPFIRVVPLSPDNPPDTTAFDGIIFTSQQAVEAFFRTHRPTSRQQVFAIGPVTSRALHARGIRKITIAPRHDSDSLAELIATAPRCSLLYPCSNRSNNILHSLDTVTPVVWYRVENRLQKPFDLSSYYGIVFSSPSTVHSFLATFTQLPSDTILYVLGEKTRNALLNNGAQERMIVTVSIH